MLMPRCKSLSVSSMAPSRTADLCIDGNSLVMPLCHSQLAVRSVMQVVCNYAYSGTYAINSVDNSVAAVHCIQDVILDFEVHTNDVNETCFSAKPD